MRSLRVLHGPVNVGNHPWVLSRGERALGVDSDLVVNFSTWLKYPSDVCLGDLGDRSRAARWRRFKFGLTAPLRYQVLHYYFGQSFFTWGEKNEPHFLWSRDLQLARLLGRKVFLTLQGCDARLSDRSAELHEVTMCHEGHCKAAATCRQLLDARRRLLIERVLVHADRVFVLNPDLVRFVPGATFLPYANFDVAAIAPSWPKSEGTIRILHAPSDPAIKGTKFIVEAVERLKERYPIEFIQVAGLPHEEALKLYPQADLVIDQVLAGWYGGFAVEMMAMGKPVACYLRESDLGFVPKPFLDDVPILRVHPHTLQRDLELLLAQRDRWRAWGERSREFVLRWHDPARIARAMVDAYRHPQSHFSLV